MLVLLTSTPRAIQPQGNENQELETYGDIFSEPSSSASPLANRHITLIPAEKKLLNDEQLRSLQKWVSEAGLNEERSKAAELIIKCIRDKSTRLDLSILHLNSLPKEIGLCTSLTELNLSENSLESLPEEIQYLTALTELDLSFNEFEELPEEIGRLQSLKSLFLMGNHLASFDLLPEDPSMD